MGFCCAYYLFVAKNLRQVRLYSVFTSNLNNYLYFDLVFYKLGCDGLYVAISSGLLDNNSPNNDLDKFRQKYQTHIDCLIVC